MAYWADTMQFKVSSSDQVNINKWAGRESPTVEFSTAKESGNRRRVRSTGCRYDQCLVLSSFSLSLLWVIHGLTWRYGCPLASTERVHETAVTGQISATESRQQSKRMEMSREWLSITSQMVAVFRTKKKGPTADHVGLERRWTLGQSYSRWQRQYELCLRDKKGTIGEQCTVSKTCSRSW